MRKAWIKLDGKQWLFDEESWTLDEWFIIKNATGLARIPFLNGVLEEDPFALQGLVWLLRSRDGEPNLRLSDVNFRPADLDWDAVEEPDAVPPSVGDAEPPKTSEPDGIVTSTSSPAGSVSPPAMLTP